MEVEANITDGESEQQKYILVYVWPKDLTPTPLQVTEILYNPLGQKEGRQWLELRNRSEKAIYLSPIKINQEELLSDIWMAPNSYQIIPINIEDQKTLTIQGPFQQTLVKADLPPIQKGSSFALHPGGEWLINHTPTPAKANLVENWTIPPNIKKEEQQEITASIVTVAPHTLFKNTFFTQSPNLKITFSKLLDLGLEEGQLINLANISGDESTLSLKKASDFEITEDFLEPEVITALAEDLDHLPLYSLVKIGGFITKKTSTNLYIGDLKINIKKTTDIDISNVQLDDRLEVTGILDQTKSGLRILPRSPEDLEIIKSKLPETFFGGPSTQLLNIETEKNKSSGQTIPVLPLGLIIKILLAITIPFMLILALKWIPNRKHVPQNSPP